MVNISKRELKERTFIPYEIVITINSQQDQNDLESELRHVRTGIFSFRSGAISNLLDRIKQHVN